MGKRTEWKKPKTLSERWEDWFPSPDSDDVRPRNRRGREVGPSKNELIGVKEDERDQALRDAIERKERNENLGYANRDELLKAYESGEVTDSDISRGGVKGFYPAPEDTEINIPENNESNDGAGGGNDQIQESNEELNIALQQRADAEKNLLLVKQGSLKKQEIANLGGQEYTTNFREAFRNANKTQAWEDTMDGDAPLEKSNVFSKAAMDWGMYKAGDTLGVMTRNQRRAYDQAVADAAINKANKANDVVEQDEARGGSGVYKPDSDPNKLKEWTTDQEANEEGKIIDAAEKIDINQEPTLIPKIEKEKVEL